MSKRLTTTIETLQRAIDDEETVQGVKSFLFGARVRATNDKRARGDAFKYLRIAYDALEDAIDTVWAHDEAARKRAHTSACLEYWAAQASVARVLQSEVA